MIHIFTISLIPTSFDSAFDTAFDVFRHRTNLLRRYSLLSRAWRTWSQQQLFATAHVRAQGTSTRFLKTLRSTAYAAAVTQLFFHRPARSGACGAILQACVEVESVAFNDMKVFSEDLLAAKRESLVFVLPATPSLTPSSSRPPPTLPLQR
jgi:hypothetical protein